MSDSTRKEDPVQVAMQAAGTAPPAFDDVDRIYREHHERVFRAAYRITGNATDAEDVLQTVFLRVLRRNEVPLIADTAASYLKRAAVNAALDLARRRATLRAAPLEDAEASGNARELGDARPGPERASESREVREHLRTALSALPPRAAEMFCLRYLEGYTNREIARMLGASWSTVAVTLHRARTRLRKEIGPVLGGRP
jgi:RNA polymerase sigma-70 factor (ECF subfamily)